MLIELINYRVCYHNHILNSQSQTLPKMQHSLTKSEADVLAHMNETQSKHEMTMTGNPSSPIPRFGDILKELRINSAPSSIDAIGFGIGKHPIWSISGLAAGVIGRYLGDEKKAEEGSDSGFTIPSCMLVTPIAKIPLQSVSLFHLPVPTTATVRYEFLSTAERALLLANPGVVELTTPHEFTVPLLDGMETITYQFDETARTIKHVLVFVSGEGGVNVSDAILYNSLPARAIGTFTGNKEYKGMTLLGTGYAHGIFEKRSLFLDVKLAQPAKFGMRLHIVCMETNEILLTNNMAWRAFE